MSKSVETAASLARECQDSGILAATFSAPHRGAQEKFNKIRLRPIQLKGGDFYQLEQFGGVKAFHRNVSPAEIGPLIEEWLSGTYGRAEISTAAATLQVFAKSGGALKVLRKKAATPAAPRTHDRAKRYILEEGNPVPFLVDLGIMAKDGTVHKAMHHKFRQINRFLEFIADTVPELRLAARETIPGTAARQLTIIDFGCGKGYLTFATYHYLAILQALPVRIIGLDLKAEVMADCERLARGYGYTGLSFETGDIASWRGTSQADMVISLHACDTASDLALAQAVGWQARVILAAPCCQHELNAQLSDKALAAAPGRVALQAAFKYGIVRERMAALLTDVLRAELLEAQGYQTQILEFIEMDDTPKNLLIRAVRQEQPKPAGESASYQALRDFLGAQPMLEQALKKA